jgi:hypothetical protein
VHLSFGRHAVPVIRLRAPDESITSNAYATAADSG